MMREKHSARSQLANGICGSHLLGISGTFPSTRGNNQRGRLSSKAFFNSAGFCDTTGNMKHILESTSRTVASATLFRERKIAKGKQQWKPYIGALVALLLIAEAPLRSQTAQSPNPQTPSQQSPPQNQAPGQQNPPANSIAVDVNLVTMLATVRDKHGKLINNLAKDDFVLQQDGHAQTVKYFEKEANLPLTLGLLVDTSMSQRRVLDQEKAASRTFVDHVLREDRDKAFLIHFDREVELLQELTNSRQKLEAALEQVGAPQFSQTSSSGGSNDPDNDGGGRGGHGGGRAMHGGGTVLYDAIYLASDELMKKQPGRKAVIVLTDGVDRGSKVSLQEAIASAQRADTEVYSILFADKEGYGDRDRGGFGGPRMGGGGMGRGGGGYPRRTEEQRPDGKKILEQISRETGGRFFEVTKKQTVDQIYTEIDVELRNQYSLGYTPEKADATAGYHKIQLTVKQKELIVQTREGYYAGQ
jgi:VWFA-related protein